MNGYEPHSPYAPSQQKIDAEAGFDTVFDDIDGDESQLLQAEKEVEGASVPIITYYELENPPKAGPGGIHGNNHMFQEMAIVKKRLGFDEQELRERIHATSNELSAEFKGIIS